MVDNGNNACHFGNTMLHLIIEWYVISQVTALNGFTCHVIGFLGRVDVCEKQIQLKTEVGITNIGR
jgi:hypothetical protein